MIQRTQKTSWRSNLRLLALSLIIVFPGILPGITYGYSSVILPQLNLTLSDASWFSSISLFGSPFGSLLSGLIIDKYGRKLCLISSIIPNIVGWFLLAGYYPEFKSLTGRFLTGFTSGAATYVSSVYLAEFIVRNKVNMRSSLATWSSTASTFGICLVYFLGSFLKYTNVALVTACLATTFLVLVVVFVPESPIWLYKQGRTGDAEEILQRLKIEPLISRTTYYQLIPPNSSSSPLLLGSWKKIVRTLVRQDVYKPLVITTILLSFSMLSGGTTLTSYLFNNIKAKAITEEESHNLSMVSAMVQVAVSISITFILPCIGNRMLTIISGIGVTLGTSVIGTTFLLANMYENQFLQDVRIGAIWFSISIFSLGFLTLPNALLGELFPIEMQGIASIPVIISFLVNCLMVQLHSYLFSSLEGSIYLFYSVMGALGTYLVYLFMPETVGKTLEHIRCQFL